MIKRGRNHADIGICHPAHASAAQYEAGASGGILAVNQATVSRWERGILPVTVAQARRLESIFASPSSSADAPLTRTATPAVCGGANR